MNQIKNAKTIILSRTQKASAETMQYAVKSINKHNPGASVITTPWEQLSADKIRSVAENKNSRLIETHLHMEQQHCHDCCCSDHTLNEHDHDYCHEHHANESFGVWSIETPKVFQIHKIEQALQNINRYGMILRAKGIVPVEDNQWIQFDYVPGEVSQKETASDYTGRLCVIGQNLDKDGLTSLFEV